MKLPFSKARVLIVVAVVIALVLVFPSNLYAKDISVVAANSKVQSKIQHSAMVFGTKALAPAVARASERRAGELLLLREDSRLRAATALVSDRSCQASLKSCGCR